MLQILYMYLCICLPSINPTYFWLWVLFLVIFFSYVSAAETERHGEMVTTTLSHSLCSLCCYACMLYHIPTIALCFLSWKTHCVLLFTKTNYLTYTRHTHNFSVYAFSFNKEQQQREPCRKVSRVYGEKLQNCRFTHSSTQHHQHSSRYCRYTTY